MAALPQLEPWEALRQGERLLDLSERWWLAEHPDGSGRDLLRHAHEVVLRGALRETLGVIHSWFRDLLALKQPDLLTNPDWQEALRIAAQQYPPGVAVAACRALEELRQDLAQNANVRLAAEALFVRLIGLARS
jgi:DNA polymerase III gamma/tau subunit